MKEKHDGYCFCKKCIEKLVESTGLSYDKIKQLLKGFKKGHGSLMQTSLRNWHEGVELYAQLQKVVKK